MAASNKSLETRPRLKQSRTVIKGTISILQNNDEARTYLSEKNKVTIPSKSRISYTLEKENTARREKIN